MSLSEPECGHGCSRGIGAIEDVDEIGAGFCLPEPGHQCHPPAAAAGQRGAGGGDQRDLLPWPDRGQRLMEAVNLDTRSRKA